VRGGSIAPLVLNFGARVEWSAFTPPLFYPPNRRLDRPKSRSGHSEAEKNLLPLSGIELGLLVNPASSQVTILTELSWLVAEILRPMTCSFYLVCIKNTLRTTALW
jgi:hypothetical protein